MKRVIVIALLLVVAFSGCDISPKKVVMLDPSPENNEIVAVEYIEVNYDGIVNVEGLNVREKPSRDSKSVGSLSQGNIVNVLKKTKQKFQIDDSIDYWIFFEIPGDSAIEGWVFNEFIDVNTDRESISEDNTDKESISEDNSDQGSKNKENTDEESISEEKTGNELSSLSSIITGGRWLGYRDGDSLFSPGSSAACEDAPMIPNSDGYAGYGYEFNLDGTFGYGMFNSGDWNHGRWTLKGNKLSVQYFNLKKEKYSAPETMEIVIEDDYHIQIITGGNKAYYAKTDPELMEIIFDKNFSAFKKYFKDGNNLNTQFSDNLTPLSLVVAHDWNDAALYLIQLGANIESQNVFGMTVLHYASQGHMTGSEWDEIVTVLLEQGADPNAMDYLGHTPLDYTICQDRNYNSEVKAKRNILRAFGAVNGTQSMADYVHNQDGIGEEAITEANIDEDKIEADENILEIKLNKRQIIIFSVIALPVFLFFVILIGLRNRKRRQ